MSSLRDRGASRAEERDRSEGRPGPGWSVRDRTKVRKVSPLRARAWPGGLRLLGRWGDWLVELAASWTMVMILTGLYMWWPRPFTPAGTFWPRLSLRGRPLLKDLHRRGGASAAVRSLAHRPCAAGPDRGFGARRAPPCSSHRLCKTPAQAGIHEHRRRRLVAIRVHGSRIKSGMTRRFSPASPFRAPA
ncbi:MAG TPA: PepSY domain-containing protein [Allosphingosinicella sp.]|nr:PepSY domain-containing protein [Allosphingosinicella sp.]